MTEGQDMDEWRAEIEDWTVGSGYWITYYHNDVPLLTDEGWYRSRYAVSRWGARRMATRGLKALRERGVRVPPAPKIIEVITEAQAERDA